MQIAMQLHCPLGMLLVDEIELPREDGDYRRHHAGRIILVQ
jgi:hypothetical protein